MFFSFVDELRAAGIPASMKEHLTLLEALDASVISAGRRNSTISPAPPS
jgi:uncharacterized protein with von Willebrand factor type A (vWA) domain